MPIFPWGPIPYLIKNKRNSKVTIELRDLVNSGFCLFDFDYPIWNESHRQVLENKIVNHYSRRQIGFETPGAFKHELACRMREIMPYYVKLYKTTMFKYNPIENYNMIEEGTDNSKGNSKGSGTSKNKNRYSETPMGKLENLDNYLTNATLDDTENNTESTDTREDKHKLTRKGNIGVTTTQQMIEAERKLIIDIDRMIIDELKDLFLLVY